MGADRKSPNAVFAVLGVVAVVLLVTLMTVWIHMDMGRRTLAASPQVSSQPPSGRGSVPEKQQSMNTGEPDESDDQQQSMNTGEPDESDDQDHQAPADPVGPVAPPVSTPVEANDNRARNIYIIAPGDTLSGISAATGVSVDKLAYVNGIADVNLIYAGSALEIPVS